MTKVKDAHVLYVDHQGHPAPLSMSYHATASRRLASAVDRHPPSAITEVDSAFCPQCLTFHDANSASNLGYCPKETCRLCPLCRAVASVTADGTDLVYSCGLCDWTSRACSVAHPVAVGSDGNISKQELKSASEGLGKELAARHEQTDHSAEDCFKSMLRSLENMAREQVKGQRSTFYSSGAFTTRRRDVGDYQTWSVASLEASLVAKSEVVAASLVNNTGGRDLQSFSLEVEQLLDSSMEGKSVDSILLQGDKINAVGDLLPLRIPLRPRKSRRCRAELAEGRPGILLKPKLNPLEGDSSLRTGHGQWWKKDSSGIHVLPRMQIGSHGTDGSKHALLIKIANPTLGAIRLRLAASGYTGEPVWDEADETDPVFRRLLVDSLANTEIDATLFRSAVDTLKETEICELEPAEDSFLELGKTKNDDPKEVEEWNADTVLSNSDVDGTNKPSNLRLLAQKSASAWFELVVTEADKPETTHAAVPIALQIEVGNGSWESSLIRTQATADDGPDMVSFDVVLAWDVSA